jgi:hypothetical protein
VRIVASLCYELTLCATRFAERCARAHLISRARWARTTESLRCTFAYALHMSAAFCVRSAGARQLSIT